VLVARPGSARMSSLLRLQRVCPAVVPLQGQLPLPPWGPVVVRAAGRGRRFDERLEGPPNANTRTRARLLRRRRAGSWAPGAAVRSASRSPGARGWAGPSPARAAADAREARWRPQGGGGCQRGRVVLRDAGRGHGLKPRVFTGPAEAHAFRLSAYAVAGVTSPAYPHHPPAKITILLRVGRGREIIGADGLRAHSLKLRGSPSRSWRTWSRRAGRSRCGRATSPSGLASWLCVRSAATLDSARPPQVEIMAGTGILIAAHGAGLTNMMYLPAKAVVIEVFPCVRPRQQPCRTHPIHPRAPPPLPTGTSCISSCTGLCRAVAGPRVGGASHPPPPPPPPRPCSSLAACDLQYYRIRTEKPKGPGGEPFEDPHFVNVRVPCRPGQRARVPPSPLLRRIARPTPTSLRSKLGTPGRATGHRSARPLHCHRP